MPIEPTEKAVRAKKKSRAKVPKNGRKKFWSLGIEEANTAQFDIVGNNLVVREGNYQYNLTDIIKKHGTPTEIFFPTIVENRVRDLIETFNAYIKVVGYKAKFHYHYPMKVNQNREVVFSAVAEGANLDVASADRKSVV